MRIKSVEGRSQVKIIFQERRNDQLLKCCCQSSKLRTGFGNMKVFGDLDKKVSEE